MSLNLSCFLVCGSLSTVWFVPMILSFTGKSISTRPPTGPLGAFFSADDVKMAQLCPQILVYRWFGPKLQPANPTRTCWLKLKGAWALLATAADFPPFSFPPFPRVSPPFPPAILFSDPHAMLLKKYVALRLATNFVQPQPRALALSNA